MKVTSNNYLYPHKNTSNLKNFDIVNNGQIKTKVELIKEEIQNGTYKIDLNETAKKIAETLI